MPTSLPVIAFVWCSLRRPAHSVRFLSARDSRQPHRARFKVCISLFPIFEAARAELVSRGVEISEVFHGGGDSSTKQGETVA